MDDVELLVHLLLALLEKLVLLQVLQISSQAQTFEDVLNQVLDAVYESLPAHKVKQHLFDVRIVQLALVLKILLNCTLRNDLLVVLLLVVGYPESLLGAWNNWFERMTQII